MAEQWYKTSKVRIDIEPVNVENYTDKSVWIKNSFGNTRRHQMLSDYDQYFPSKAEAVSHVRDRLLRELESAKRSVETVTEKLEDFEAKYVGE